MLFISLPRGKKVRMKKRHLTVYYSIPILFTLPLVLNLGELVVSTLNKSCFINILIQLPGKDGELLHGIPHF